MLLHRAKYGFIRKLLLFSLCHMESDLSVHVRKVLHDLFYSLLVDFHFKEGFVAFHCALVLVLVLVLVCWCWCSS